MLQSHLHTPRDRLTDIMNSYLLLICISFVPASVSICATLPLWFSKHMQNRIIRLSGLALLSLIMAGGLLLAFACQNPWFGLSCIAVSSMNIPLFRHYELLLSTLRCSKCHHISLHLLSVQKKVRPFDLTLKRRLPTLPRENRSTIGVSELNFSVRNGKRWDLTAITT